MDRRAAEGPLWRSWCQAASKVVPGRGWRCQFAREEHPNRKSVGRRDGCVGAEWRASSSRPGLPDAAPVTWVRGQRQCEMAPSSQARSWAVDDSVETAKYTDPLPD